MVMRLLNDEIDERRRNIEFSRNLLLGQSLKAVALEDAPRAQRQLLQGGDDDAQRIAEFELAKGVAAWRFDLYARAFGREQVGFESASTDMIDREIAHHPAGELLGCGNCRAAHLACLCGCVLDDVLGEIRAANNAQRNSHQLVSAADHNIEKRCFDAGSSSHARAPWCHKAFPSSGL
jgi:hypothetical protein